ncbi:MAG: divergent polysaccharide deacetylase family protein [Roseococcus sp.]|nr:divergent polysaccharide deacetylase family protein [Roseococcus sp.]
MTEKAEGAPPARRGWRWLGLFWAACLALFAVGAAILAWLGPPPAPEAAESPAPPGATPEVPAAAAPAPAPPPPLPTLAAGQASPHIDGRLVEPSPQGLLPRIGADGRMPMRVYARPFDRNDPRPRAALVVGGLGMNTALTEQAIQSLPPAVGLAFSPYAPRPYPLLERARERGFETLVAIPMEPTGFPLNDPGQQALLTGLAWTENARRLDWVLSRYAGHAGAIGALGPLRGERFAAMAEPHGQMQAVLAQRGLYYIDPRAGAPSPARAWGRSLDVVVDEPPSRAEIELRLAELERLARERGAALGYAGEASPVAIARIAAWAAGLEARGVVLAPPSALARAPSPEMPPRAETPAPRPATPSRP